jgi:hypothetical protein
MDADPHAQCSASSSDRLLTAAENALAFEGMEAAKIDSIAVEAEVS